MKKNMLIIGDTGFIGGACLRYFSNNSEKYDITCVNLSSERSEKIPGVTYLTKDMRIEENVVSLLKGKDIVLQMAATTTGSKDVIERPWLHVTDNAVMNSWILREAHLNGVEHVIFPSCTVMYQPKEEAQKESDWRVGDDIYGPYFGVGKMKVFVEDMCKFYASRGTTKYTAIRHSNVYGPHDKFDFDKCHMVPAMVRKVAEAESNINIWGRGKAKRDILYIDDLVRFIDLALHNQNTSYELYNCGFGEAFTIQYIIETLKNHSNKDLAMDYDISKPDIPTTVVLDCSKAEKELGWTPLVHPQEGLVKTYQWFLS